MTSPRCSGRTNTNANIDWLGDDTGRTLRKTQIQKDTKIQIQKDPKKIQIQIEIATTRNEYFCHLDYAGVVHNCLCKSIKRTEAE